MGFNTSQQAYGQGVGTTPTGGIWIDTRNPTTADVGAPWPLGQFWLNNSTSNLYYLNSFSSTSGYVQANWVLISIVNSLLQTLSDTANTAVSSSGSSGSPNPYNIQLINTDGSLTITSDNANNRIILSANNSGSTWTVTTTNRTLADNAAWFSNGGAQLEFTLPATSAVGDTYEVVAMNAAGWIIKQGAGQQITVGINQTTLGAAGSIASLNRGDWIRIVCNVANTGFFATILEGNCVTV